MTQCTVLTSATQLDDIEHHFRVKAGPGSGKTHWLVGHVRRVAQLSDRLSPCSRIAVISYTNVAVREIQRRLESAADVTDASTIHSFLFRHVVRPYLHLLKNADGSDLSAHHLIDTHTEHYLAHDILDEWLGLYGRRQLLIPAHKNNLDLLRLRLRAIAVRLSDSGSPYLAPCKTEPRDRGILDLLTSERLLNYKSRYWMRGQIDHEDVLYFSYRLLSEFPVLNKFLSAKFPYLFIDEFQDTLPVQAAVVRWLAAEGTIVGVIGDPEQAIYGFLDASPSHFNSFQLSGYKSYSIEGNRRSTGAIVSLLNRVRTDGLAQLPIQTKAGSPATVYFGNLSDCLSHARSVSLYSESMLVLARSHKGVLRARRPEAVAAAASWDQVEAVDADRCRFLMQLASATDLTQRGFFDLAIQRLVQGISSRKRFRSPMKYDFEVTIEKRRAVALLLLEYMVSSHNTLLGMNTLDVYRLLVEHVTTCLTGLTLSKAVRGKFCEQAAECPYVDLVHGLKTADETRLTRTIHQAKGGEAEAVFVVLDDDDADHILQPLPGQEEQRITYVALSRAKSELYIYCPELNRTSAFSAIGLTALTKGEPQIIATARPAASRRRKPKQ